MHPLPDTPFRTAEAAALGLPRGRLRALERSGALRAVFHGVRIRGDLVDDLASRADAAALVLPEHCVVSDRSAAWLHGVDVLDLVEHASPPRLEVVSIAGQASELDGVLGGKRDLRPDEICEVHGVRVTTPVRTALDVACLRGRHRAIGTLDAFRRQHGLTVQDYRDQLARFVRRRGVVQARELAELATDLAESFPESWARLDAHDHQIELRPQVETVIPGWGRIRFDLADEPRRIAVEYDGEQHHSTPQDRDHDDARRRAAREHGWVIVVVRRDGFSGPRRDAWLGELRNAIALRSPQPDSKRRYSRSPVEVRYRSRTRWR